MAFKSKKLPLFYAITAVQGNTHRQRGAFKSIDLTGATIRVEFRRQPNQQPFLVFSTAPASGERLMSVTVVPASGTTPVKSNWEFRLLEADTRTIGEFAHWNMDVVDSAGDIRTFYAGEISCLAEGQYARP